MSKELPIFLHGTTGLQRINFRELKRGDRFSFGNSSKSAIYQVEKVVIGTKKVPTVWVRGI